MINRRTFIGAGALVAGSGVTLLRGVAQESEMYGLIGRIETTPGQRDALAAILLEGVGGMPGCRSYVVANDPGDPDALWVTEVWDSQDSHAASLSMPSVQDAIRRGRPMIAGFSQRFETQPVGGHGLA